MSGIAIKPALETGQYRHYKGGEYEVLDIVCHSETHEWHVLYRPLYEHAGMPDLWIRPYSMFIEEVDIDGRTVKRFEYVTLLDRTQA